MISKFNLIYLIIFILIFSCSKKVDQKSTLKEKNLETQMIEVYNEAMKEFESGDVIYAGKNDDHLDGGLGDDRLYGYHGNDTLIGGQGDDLLLAGIGSNVYKGGAGADRFGLMKKHENTIDDFDPSQGDKLLIRSKHVDSIEITVMPDHSEGSSFELKSKIGTCIINATLEASSADIFNSITVM